MLFTPTVMALASLSSFSRFVAVSSRCGIFKTVPCFFSSEEIANNDIEGQEESKGPFMKEISRATSSLRVDTIAANGLGISKR